MLSEPFPDINDLLAPSPSTEISSVHGSDLNIIQTVLHRLYNVCDTIQFTIFIRTVLICVSLNKEINAHTQNIRIEFIPM